MTTLDKPIYGTAVVPQTVRPLNIKALIPEPKATDPDEVVVGLKDRLMALWNEVRVDLREKYRIDCVGRLMPDGRHRTLMLLVPNHQQYTNDQLTAWAGICERLIAIENEPLSVLGNRMIIGSLVVDKPHSTSLLRIGLEEFDDWIWEILEFFEGTPVETLQ